MPKKADGRVAVHTNPLGINFLFIRSKSKLFLRQQGRIFSLIHSICKLRELKCGIMKIQKNYNSQTVIPKNPPILNN